MQFPSPAFMEILELVYHPHRRTYALIHITAGGKRAIAAVINQVIRQTDARSNFNHIKPAIAAILLDRILSALDNGDLGFQRGILLRAG